MSLDPFDSGTGPPPNLYRYRENDERWTEKKYGDNEMLGVWEMTDLPAGAVVTHATLIPYRGEKAVVSWRDGKLLLPEGDVAEGEDVEAAVKRIAAEQAGILDPVVKHLGHLHMRATVYHKTQAKGTETYQALYALEVGSLADFPTDSAYERRILLQRDLNRLIRESYILFRKEYTEALDGFLLERLKANLHS
jgi:hypothetical protein